MKVYYLNDEQKEMHVKIVDDKWNHGEDNLTHYHKLKPAEGRLFELSAPEGSIPFVKKWTHTVMISYVDPTCLPQPEQVPQGQEDE